MSYLDDMSIPATPHATSQPSHRLTAILVRPLTVHYTCPIMTSALASQLSVQPKRTTKHKYLVSVC